MGVQAVGNKYYDDIEKFKQNYNDFMRKSLPAIKQELVGIQGWGQGLDQTFIDKMSYINKLGGRGAIISPAAFVAGKVGQSSVDEKNAGLKPTTSDAVRALIYMEECQSNPYAYYDLNDRQVLNDPQLKPLVEEAKKSVAERAEQRFAYIKANYIDKDKPLVDKQKYANNTAVSSLDHLLWESRVSLIAAEDQAYADKQNVDGYSAFLQKKLETENAEMFKKLEELYQTNPTELFVMYAQLPYYRNQLNEHAFEEREEQEKISHNASFFEQYMIYKTLGKLPAEFPAIDFDPDKIDYNQIHDLLTSFTINPKVLEASELADRGEFLDNAQFLLRYGVSLNIGQNVLYEIAKNVLNYP